MARKKKLVCPRCKSDNLEFTGNDKKGFSAGKAAVAGVFTLGLGLLAGATGKKAKNNSFLCMDCGKNFKKKI